MDKRLTPHNQFILLFTGMGLLGLGYITVLVFLPIFYRLRYQSLLFIVIQTVLITSLLTEATLETQRGIALYLFFTLFLIRYGNNVSLPHLKKKIN